MLAGLTGVLVPFAGLMASTPEAPATLAGLGGLAVGAVGAIRALDRDRAETALAAEQEHAYQADERYHNLLFDAYASDAMCRWCDGWHPAARCPDVAEVA
jgi:hypothetical protein